jgi:tetratricopeptide (TPR) repeat protein
MVKSRQLELWQRRLPLLTRWIAAALFVVSAAVPVSASVYGNDRGARPAVLEPCDALYDKGDRIRGRQCYSALLDQHSDPFTQAEIWWVLGQAKRANDLFRAAVEADPANPDVRVRWGYLFEQTHNEGEAVGLFQEALEIDKEHVAAQLGVAWVMGKRFDPKSQAAVEKVMENQDDLILGHLLISRLALEVGELAIAEEHLGSALQKVEASDRSPLETYALHASLDLVRGVSVDDSKWTAKALAYNPTYGQLYSTVAHYYIVTRRYREAIALYQKAIEIDPELYTAHADLAVSLMRENRDAEAYRHLEIAFKGDPFSAQTVNTLRLVDSFEKFKLYSSRDDGPVPGGDVDPEALSKPEIIVRLHEDEDEILRPYVMALAEQSAAVFAKKYNFKPEKPIYVELYPNHDDFAVRTMGMPGIGLLGVTFGYLVAMDSPSSREPGQFHWGTTLWHEMAHVFTLEATNHLVPRWYSEGISMYEEWEARPVWGERVTPPFIRAFAEGKLLPIAELDKGFMRPTYDDQVVVSYFQAGLVCQMIDRQWGADKLLQLLEAFARNTATADAITEVLEVETEVFDERLQSYIEDLLGPLAEKGGIDHWSGALKEAVAAMREETWDEAVEPANRAKELYPDYTGSGNPYSLLSIVYEKREDRTAATSELLGYYQHGGRDPGELKKLAEWLDDAGRREEATAVLDELLYIWPADEELHADLGDWLLADGDSKAALREFNVLLGMDPHDKAAAYFRLAETYHKMGDSQRARRNLLRSLEIAPTYRPAQRLLLEMAR